MSSRAHAPEPTGAEPARSSAGPQLLLFWILAPGLGLCAFALWRSWLSWPLALVFAAAFLLAAGLAAAAVRRVRTAAREEIARRRESEQEAQAANRSKSTFLANMSHELRTPLNAILGTADLLLGFPVPPRQRKHLQVIAASAESLLLLIEDILDFAKLEAGRLRFDFTFYHPREILESARDLLEARAAEQGLELRLEVAPELPETLLGDAGRLRQLLLNLGGNAVKYTPSGSVRIRAELVRPEPGTSGEERMRIMVQDTGIGISPQDQRHIFETFYQADSSTARRVGGSGLGLAICREIVEGMGGEIGFSSERSVGSTFWFELPLAAGPEAEPETAAQESAPEPRPSFDRSRFRVLVVDDQATNRNLALAQLESLGYEAAAASGGHQALSLLASESFDAVLMDCQMPELDGYDTTRRLRRREATGAAGETAETGEEKAPTRLPVIALTASATPEEREKSLAVGMDELLTKPYRGAQLDAVLCRWLAPAGEAPAPPPTEPADAAPEKPPSLFEERIEALRRMGERTHRDVLGETTGTYLRESRALVAALREAHAHGDLGALAQAAHALAGSSGILGNEQLAALAQQLRALALGERSGPLAPLLQQLRAEHERFVDLLRRLRGDAPSLGSLSQGQAGTPEASS